MSAQTDRPLGAEELELKVVLAERASEMERTLEEWSNLNTGSFHPEGLAAQAELLATRLRTLGFEVETREGPEVDLPGRDRVRTGPLVIGRREASVGAETAPRFLLAGHYDTVFEPDSSFQEFRALEDGPLRRATGPGVSDMKGGLVVMMEALQALQENRNLARAHVVVLLNADEEIGSLGSRPVLEEEARRADYGLVFESAQRGGALVRSRRGLGQFHLSVDGVESHAGSAHERGRSAIRALATKVLEIEALTDYERGITLNVGTFEGGTKRNIVPGHAEAWIDLRYDDPQAGEQIRDEIERIAAEPHVDGTTTRVWGALHRPPKVATPQVDRLIGIHARVARGITGSQPPPPLHSGGGTDGSLMGGVGLPTLDSMGAVGGRAHTEEEFVLLDSLPERAAIAAILMQRLIDAQLYAPPGGR